jgi:hypothetical protein
MQTMERGVFLKRLQGGLKEWPGVQIILDAARVGGTWSNWYDSFMRCGGFNGRDRNCVPELDAKFDKYLASTDHTERKEPGHRNPARHPGELLFRASIPPCRHAGNRPAHRRQEVAGRVADNHHRLCLPLGRHQAEGVARG